MAMTNFARLTDHEKKAWSMDFWKNAREKSFLTRILGTSDNAVCQRITELKKSEKGTKAIITLVPDPTGDGVAGDRTLKGNEEVLTSEEAVIRIDQLRHAHGNEGRIADQKSIVNFRKEARDKLSFWIGNRIDQMAFLTMSGVSYAYRNDGAARVGSELQYLEFAADVTAPSTNRHFRWTGNTTGLLAGDTTANDMAKPTYQMLLELKAKAQNEYLQPVSGDMGTELFHVFMTPNGIKALKLDTTFQSAVRDAMPRSADNPLFKGFDVIYVDGMAIHTNRYVFNTLGATSGSGKWGSAHTTDGQRIIFAGKQALAYADIGSPYWDEENDDYGNRYSIAVGKIFGFLKPQFKSQVHGTTEDFGLMVCDTTI